MERNKTMKEIELKVDGMSCEGCENRIQKALKEIDGIEEVVADHTRKTVKITLVFDVEIDTLKETIEDLGFEVVD